MTAETLRRAAVEMRRDAENATPGRWKLWGMTVMADQDGTSNVDTAVGVASTYYRDEHGKPRTWDARHIAGMQPTVALAVADLLDLAATHQVGFTPVARERMVAVALAYLREQP